MHLRCVGINAAVLSIDDLYFGKAHRAALARDVHPLLCTRGVPGTHDVALGLAIFDALDRGEAIQLPRFDKASDERLAGKNWPHVLAGLDVLVFEGWCVGAYPQPVPTLAEPVNELERDEDSDGRWRGFVNAALSDEYQRLFARLDYLILLAAPAFNTVYGWRLEQEQQLRKQAICPGMMSDIELRRFIQHYERLTRHILVEMPRRADLTIRLGADHSVIGTETRHPEMARR